MPDNEKHRSGAGSDKKAVLIGVPSEDCQRQNQGKKRHANKPKAEKAEMSEQARKKKADIDLLVERLQDSNEGVVKLALNTLSQELKEATSSMVSVPLPLKFLRPHFAALEKLYEEKADTCAEKRLLADVLSVLATTVPNSTRKALRYSLAGTCKDLTSWGAEYLRNIVTEIGEEFQHRQEEFVKKASSGRVVGATPEAAGALVVDDLLELVFQIVPYYVKHHNEIDAVDLLVEVQNLEAIKDYVDARNFKRITQYLIALANYCASEEDFDKTLEIVYDIFMKMNEPCEAVRVALKLRRTDRVLEVLKQCEDPLARQQIGFLLGCHRWSVPDATEHSEVVKAVGPQVAQGLNNDLLTSMFKILAEELDVIEAKLPEDVYKTHLDEKRRSTVPLDSAKHNLAATLVNAFVNCGFGHDALMTDESSTWLYKNKEYGMTTAAASLGAIMLWDVETGLARIDKYQWSPDPLVKAGALMGFGLLCSGVPNECDPAFSLLTEHLENHASSSTVEQTIGALLGLAFAYIGCPRETFLDLFVPQIIDTHLAVEVSACAALALGLSYLGTGNEAGAEALLQTLLERQLIPGNLDGPLAFLFPLAMGFLFWGQRNACEATLEALDAVHEHPIGRFTKTCVLGCAYAGTGDVTKVWGDVVGQLQVDEQQRAKERKGVFLDIVQVQHFLKYCGNEGIDSSTEGSECAQAPGGTDDGELSTTSNQPTTTTSDGQPRSSKSAHAADEGGKQPGGAVVSGEQESLTGGRTRGTGGASNLLASHGGGSGLRRSDALESQGASSASSASIAVATSEVEQSACVMGLGLVAMGEDIGSGMILRMVDHLLQYGGPGVRKGIPLCLALLSASNPRPPVVEALSKLTHDIEAETALNAILALGIVGAGSNNSRIADLLRQLATYYSKSPNALFLVRISQGLLYMGKGLLTLSPLHSDGFLVQPSAQACILVVLFSSLFMRNSFFNRYHYFLYFFVAAARPRMLITVDENIKMLPVPVRVGQALDTAGVAGNPRTVTGFQTHTTPVLLSQGERAELATSDYEPVGSLPLEGIVILRRAAGVVVSGAKEETPKAASAAQPVVA